jgi:hypothetical protein
MIDPWSLVCNKPWIIFLAGLSKILDLFIIPHRFVIDEFRGGQCCDKKMLNFNSQQKNFSYNTCGCPFYNYLTLLFMISLEI